MAMLLNKIVNGYNFLFDELGGLALLCFYVYFVNILGPRLMKDRKPFQLEKIMMVYNVAQIIVNLFLFERGLTLGWGGSYNWRCEPVDFSYSPHALEVTRMVHVYLLVKVVDLLDTVFFVLRKKDSHVSFLHVYHHTGMVASSWAACKYYPGGHGTFIGFVNTIVHVVMYTYYFITSLDPKYKKYLWWKKHITQLQIVQFLAITVHASQLLIKKTCDYPTFVAVIFVPQNLFMLMLFYDFYRKAYQPKKEE